MKKNKTEIKVFGDNLVNKSFSDRSSSTGSRQFTPLNLFPEQQKSEQNDLILIDMFNSVPEFSSPIKYTANVAALIPYKIVKVNNKGEETPVNRPDINALLDNPNPYDSRINFLRKTFINFILFGNNYTNRWKGTGSMKIASYLYLLPPQYISLIFQKMQSNQVDPNADFRTNDITGFRLKYNSFDEVIPFDEVSHFKDSQVNFDNGAYAKGQSRGYSAIMATKTIKAGYDAKFAIYKNRGAMGLFVNKDPDGVVLDPKEKRRVLKDFKGTYGLNEEKNLFKFVDKNIEYINISPDFSGLLINENNEADFRAICKAIGGFPPALLMDNRVALLRDGNQADRKLYINIVQPIVNDYYEMLSKDMQLSKDNIFIRPDYSGIASLSEDLNRKSNTLKTTNDRMLSLYDVRLVTGDQVLEAQGLEPQNLGLKPEEGSND